MYLIWVCVAGNGFYAQMLRLAQRRDQNPSDQILAVAPDGVLRAHGPLRDHKVVADVLGETPRRRAAPATDRVEDLDHPRDVRLCAAVVAGSRPLPPHETATRVSAVRAAIRVRARTPEAYVGHH